MYMSYCRYSGTAQELRVCLNDVEEHVNGEAEDAVSDGEIDSFVGMVEMFHGWLLDMGLLKDDGELDRDELDNVCSRMMRGLEVEE